MSRITGRRWTDEARPALVKGGMSHGSGDAGRGGMDDTQERESERARMISTKGQQRSAAVDRHATASTADRHQVEAAQHGRAARHAGEKRRKEGKERGEGFVQHVTPSITPTSCPHPPPSPSEPSPSFSLSLPSTSLRSSISCSCCSIQSSLVSLFPLACLLLSPSSHASPLFPFVHLPPSSRHLPLGLGR
jgi:hypothetical protein